MLPGPMLIKRCDACDGLFKQRTLTSGNTCGATFWTDGKMGAPMLPRTPLLIRCPHCSSILWTKSLREVDSYPTYRGFLIFEDDEAVGNSKRAAIERKEKAYESLPFFALATFEDLNAFADGAGLSSEEELIVRRQAWLTGNDSRRHSDSPSPLTSGEEAIFLGIPDRNAT